MTTNALNKNIDEAENKILDTSILVTTTFAKIGETGNKVFDHAEYITTQKFNKQWTKN